MTGFRFILAFTLGLLLGVIPGVASTDQSCAPEIRALASGFNCNVAGTLVPENDTRDNLVFLLADRRQQKLTVLPQLFSPDSGEDYASGEGTICVSDASGSAAFQAAVNADSTIPAAEKIQLVAARQALKCGAQPPAALPAVVAQSASGKAFNDYLKSVAAFYPGNNTDAGFIALGTSTQPWVREAAVYMQARVKLLAAQQFAVGEYGDFDPAKADRAMAADARGGLQAYLRDYPNGVYANSAKGLLRRAAWFLNEPEALSIVYSDALAESAVDAAGIAMANEIDLKLPLASYTDPKADLLFLVVQDLRAMRPDFDDEGKPVSGMSASFLEAQRARFTGQERLLDYLLALRAFRVDKDAKTVVALLNDPTPTTELDYLGFSRHMLRAAALATTGDKSVRNLYVSLFPHAKQLYQRTTLELELAKLDERAKNVSAVFAGGSLVTDPDIRIKLLNHVAGPIILKQQATSANVPTEEREVAIYRLLKRDLQHGRFKGFVEDIRLLPPKPAPDTNGYVNDNFEPFRWQGGADDGYTCPAIVEIAARMAANPRNVSARLCLGDYFRVNDVWEPEAPSIDELGGTGTIFAGEPIARQEYYRDIMKSPKAARKDRAYALYRAVNCYAPIGNNACGGKEVAKSQRKAWYNELKSKYAETDWAQKLQYYW